MRKLLTLGALALVGANAEANAATSVITISGVILADPSYETQPSDTNGFFGAFEVGDSISVSYLYDRDILQDGSPNKEFYYSSGFQSTNVKIGNKELVLDRNLYWQYAIIDEGMVSDKAYQSLSIYVASYPEIPGLGGEIRGASVKVYTGDNWFVNGGSNILLQDYASVDLAQFNQALPFFAHVTGRFGDSNTFLDIAFNPTKLTVSSAAAVPEPATWAMMILGFGVVGYAMRRTTVLRFV